MSDLPDADHSPSGPLSRTFELRQETSGLNINENLRVLIVPDRRSRVVIKILTATVILLMVLLGGSAFFLLRLTGPALGRLAEIHDAPTELSNGGHLTPGTEPTSDATSKPTARPGRVVQDDSKAGPETAGGFKSSEVNDPEAAAWPMDKPIVREVERQTNSVPEAEARSVTLEDTLEEIRRDAEREMARITALENFKEQQSNRAGEIRGGRRKINGLDFSIHTNSKPIQTIPGEARLRKGSAVVGGGTWMVERDELCLGNATGEEWLLFGDRSWTDYDFSFEVLQEGFPSGISTLYRSPDDSRIQHFGFGWHNHRTSVMQYAEGGLLFRSSSPVRKVHDDPIRANRWFEFKVVVRGKTTKAYCDNELIHEIDNNPFDAGRVGVRTWRKWPGKTRFRNIKVVAPDGTILWSGQPIIRNAG